MTAAPQPQLPTCACTSARRCGAVQQASNELVSVAACSSSPLVCCILLLLRVKTASALQLRVKLVRRLLQVSKAPKGVSVLLLLLLGC